jgi:protein-L-isoaspartate(D-aspartate) O-methyltransferase
MMFYKVQMQIVSFLLLFLLTVPTQTMATDNYAGRRQDMVAGITDDVRATSRYLGGETLTPQVLQAMATVPRHQFVKKSLQPLAYLNQPLPIGYGQTISQPYIVAVMTNLLQLTPDDTVLEIGTGSGYQAAILGKIAGRVYTMEIITPLARQAKTRLQRLGYNNVEVHTGDGYFGMPLKAPFDAIMVTAAADHIPPPLIKQLKPGGRMVIPVGSRFMVQQLTVIEKTNKGKITSRQVLPVRFVPLTGDASAGALHE